MAAAAPALAATASAVITPISGPTDLGSLGGTSNMAFGINEHGTVVGFSTTSTNLTRAFLKRPGGTMQNLGTLAPYPSFAGGSVALAVNDAELVVGTSQDALFRNLPFLWTELDGMQDLPLPPEAASVPYARAVDVNEVGVIVGYYYNPTGTAGGAGKWVPSTYQWTPLSALPGGTWTEAHGINDNGLGDIVGATNFVSGTTLVSSKATLWPADGGAPVELPGPADWDGAVATSINDARAVTGYAWRRISTGSISSIGLVWTSPTAAPTTLAWPMWDINNAGIAVGGNTAWSAASGTEPLMTSGARSEARSINDAGLAVGSFNTDSATVAGLWAMPDTDGDGVPDGIDNCPMVANADQADTNGNGVGDACESTNHAPVIASITVPAVNEGAAITLSANATDADGDTLAYAWSFGDGGTGTGATPSHAYADNGSYTVALTVSDGQGGESTATATALVANVAPTVSAGPDATITSGQSLAFRGSFSDPGAADAPWSYAIDWDDNRYTTGTTTERASAITVSQQYLRAGTYTITLAVMDKDGGNGSDVLRLTVNPLAVALDACPGSGANRITLSGSTASQCDGGVSDGTAGIQVAVLSTSAFDARLVDPATVALGNGLAAGVPVARRSDGTFWREIRNVNKDGRPDVVLRFDRAALVTSGNLTPSTRQLVLLGSLLDGRQLRGTDAVKVVP